MRRQACEIFPHTNKEEQLPRNCHTKRSALLLFYVMDIMKITINTPKWIDSVYHTWKYAVASAKWIIRPPRCHVCGKRMHHGSYDVEMNWDDKHERMMVANLSGDLVCRECLVKELDAVEAKTDGVFGRKPCVRKCDCCHEKTKTYNIYTTPNMRLHFCLNWWNGFHICKACIRRTLTQGKTRFSYPTKLDMKDGKVQLFKWKNR